MRPRRAPPLVRRRTRPLRLARRSALSPVSASADACGSSCSAAGASLRLGGRGLLGGLPASATAPAADVSPCCSSCSMRASIRPYRFCSGALISPAIAFSGPRIAPSTWPRSTSAGGSLARSSTSCSLIGRPSSSPPRIARIFVVRAASESALATATGSPSDSRNAIPVGPSSMREQRVLARRLGGAPRQRVLDDAERRAVLQHLGAERVDLAHREPAVVRDEQRVRLLQLLRQLRDETFLLGFLHMAISSGNG